MEKKSLSWMPALFMTSVVWASASVSGNDVALKFNPAAYESKTLEMPDGKTVEYRAYEHIYYVTNVEDSAYQYLNYYVPESVFSQGNDDVPIFLRTYVGGYMAAKAMEPSASDATGRALQEGCAVCIPGSRGRNSVVEREGEKCFTGRAPAALLDLKAAVRYLRSNDADLPGNAERIITDGTSAGGAMSALLGATGNSPLYAPYLAEMGAADARDDVFASVCYCPIIDLEHADMAYEWMYRCVNTGRRALSDEQIAVSEELAAAYPDCLNSLGLKMPDGTPITDANYMEYIKSFLIRSAQRARDEGCEIAESTGVVLNTKRKPFDGPFPQLPDRREAPSFGPQGVMPVMEQGNFVLDIDMDTYLDYVVSTRALKTPPAFDAWGVLTDSPTGENEEFGDAKGSVANFTPYSLSKRTGSKAEPDAELQKRVYMLNPMNFVTDTAAVTASHWYIRHGARDRDTSFSVPVNFATLLANNGYDVDFALAWNRPHTGDYNLNNLFAWIKRVVAE